MDNSSGKERLRFYFSFNDPYSFLIAPTVKNLSQNYKIDIEYIPLPTFDKSGIFSVNKAVHEYYAADAERFANKAGRKLNYIDAAQDSYMVCKAHFLANEKMLGLKYINLVFAMRWLNGGDLSKTADVIESLKFLEFDTDTLTEALGGDKYNDEIALKKNQSVDDGVIGTPFIVFKDAGYMGADRFDYLEADIMADPGLLIHHDASYTVMKPDELAKALADNIPLMILDIRIPKDFGQSHIPGSNCIPSKVVHRHISDLDRDWSIVLVDDGGVAASETGFMLASEGFKKVSVLSGGFPAWKGETKKGLDNWRDKLKNK